ncbi:MAG: hypothetical protein WBR18_14835, partial [Anaerolineales bacterium]
GHWWLNDPDCLLLRQADTHLTAAEARLLATVGALSGGALFISDDLPRLTVERTHWLRWLLPPLPGNAVVPDWLDRTRPRWMRHDLAGPAGRWCLLAALNWSGRSERLGLELETVGLDPEFGYHAVDCWDGRLLPTIREGAMLDVPAHGVRLLRLSRNDVLDQPRWLGDTFHISGGLSVSSWQVDSNVLTARLDAKHPWHGQAWIQIPGRPLVVEVKPGACTWTQLADNVIRLHVEGNQNMVVTVRWEPEG